MFDILEKLCHSKKIDISDILGGVTVKKSIFISGSILTLMLCLLVRIPEPAYGAEEGRISKPDHPETVTNDKLIFIGDSRTEGIRDAVQDDSIWSCLSSMGYDWIEVHTSVIFLRSFHCLYSM